MARFRVSLQLLLCLITSKINTIYASTTIIDATGTINKRASPLPATSKGVITVISSPGDSSGPFGISSEEVMANVDEESGCIVVKTPGATLQTSGSSISGSSGSGSVVVSAAAAASSIAGAIVVTGVTSSDCNVVGIGDTRHGKTLYSIFATNLEKDMSDVSDGEKTLLIVAVEGTVEDELSVMKDISSIFDACVVAVTGEENISLGDLFDVEIVSVHSSDDAAMVMSTAVAAGSRSPLSQTSENVISAITQAYTTSSTTDASSSSSFTTTTSTTPISSSTLLCDDSYARHSRSSRAKLSTWKRRVDRSLLVDQFGSQATTLLQRTMEAYDKDTFLVSGREDSGYGPAKHRLELRTILKSRMENQIRDLFDAQVSTLEKQALKKLNSRLLASLQQTPSQQVNGGEELQENAAAVRTAAFAFETAMEDLEIPMLSLTKEKYTQAMASKLNEALIAFPDSPAAQLKGMKQVQSKASKDKKPTQRSIEAGLALVAMIRPDGFGNLQGFAGYSMGSNSVTVGVHNDADAPETISQFGGSRPPFLRVQPKLNLDIEL